MKNRRERYVAGWRCKCGLIYPDWDPIALNPAPDICPNCGTARLAMERRALLEEQWETGWWLFTTQHFRYHAGKPLKEHLTS